MNTPSVYSKQYGITCFSNVFTFANYSCSIIQTVVFILLHFKILQSMWFKCDAGLLSLIHKFQLLYTNNLHQKQNFLIQIIYLLI